MTEEPERAAPYRVALIPGDGIGAEVVPLAGRLLRAVLGDRLELVELAAGWDALPKVRERSELSSPRLCGPDALCISPPGVD